MANLIWKKFLRHFNGTKGSVLIAALLAVSVVLAAGLIAVPAIEKAQASLIGAIRDRIQLQQQLRNQILGDSRTGSGAG